MNSILKLNRGVQKRINFRSIPIFTKNNYNIIQLFSLYISGLIIGTAISYKFSFIRTAILSYYSLNDEFLIVFIKNFAVYLVFFLIFFISGLSFLGSPFFNSVPILAGVLYSSTAVSFAVHIKPDGYLVFLLLKLPTSILFINTVFILTEISRIMLNKTRTSAFSESTVSKEFKEYILYYIIILIFGLICALTDASMHSLIKNILK